MLCRNPRNLQVSVPVGGRGLAGLLRLAQFSLDDTERVMQVPVFFRVIPVLIGSDHTVPPVFLYALFLLYTIATVSSITSHA